MDAFQIYIHQMVSLCWKEKDHNAQHQQQTHASRLFVYVYFQTRKSTNLFEKEKKKHISQMITILKRRLLVYFI